jgi:hypothetical protein
MNSCTISTDIRYENSIIKQNIIKNSLEYTKENSYSSRIFMNSKTPDQFTIKMLGGAGG